VLGTPPAFILSQDQTLQLKNSNTSPGGVVVNSIESSHLYSNS
jgi:hypothetical protein